MTKAYLIRANGEAPEPMEDISLKSLQTAVGGWVEVVDLGQRLSMWLNEEGKLISLPTNEVATKLFTQFYGHRDFIVGDVVITGGTDENGDTLPLDSISEQELGKLLSQ